MSMLGNIAVSAYIDQIMEIIEPSFSNAEHIDDLIDIINDIKTKLEDDKKAADMGYL